MPKLLSILLVLFTFDISFGIDAWPENEFALSGVEIVSTGGGVTLVSKDSKPTLKAVGTVYVVTTAQEIKVEAEDAKRNRLEVVEVTTPTDSPRKWVIYGSGSTWVRVDTKERILDDEDRLIDILWETWNDDFIIGESPEPPPPPPPPEPSDISPFDEPGLKVLIVYESNDVATYPATQQEIMFGKGFRIWSAANLMPQGLRVFDKDIPTDQPNVWSKVLAQPRDTLPWIYIGNGSKGFSGPLPSTVAETEDLIKRFK